MTVALESLMERVKAATGPDRLIDGDLFFELDPQFPSGARQMLAGHDPGMFMTGAYSSVKSPAYTASVDAALALVERVLPGWLVDHIGADGAGAQGQMKAFGWHCELTDGVENWPGDAPTLPLAILSALLQALISTGAK